ncbi:MAG: amidohydrolase family protein [Armatimonadota bacterium]|nr:MAG: amidohydrolase family protein [Armatimonadota bacterium]
MAGKLRTDVQIIDAHTHLETTQPEAVDAMLEKEASLGVAAMNLLMLSLPSSGYVSTNPEGFYAKWRYPDKVYLFAALDYTPLGADVDLRLAYSLPEQVRRFWAMGCDGMKMLTGKPNYRKESGLALDSIVFEPCFACLEALEFPLVWHVGDPEEFWDAELVPQWAKDSGWAYDSTFPSKEAIYAECHHVLERHPKLKVIFAHFHFLSDDLPRAAALLDRFPNVCLDLTPGSEMYRNFTKRPDETREFFLKYQGRLVFGSDFMSRGEPSPIVLVRQFLETEGRFTHPNLERPVEGIGLPLDSLKRIYAGNYQRIASPKPRPLDESLVLAELDRMAVLQDQLKAPRNTARFFATLIDGGIPADWERESILDGLML